VEYTDVLFEGDNVRNRDLDELDDPTATNALDSAADDEPGHVLGGTT
jgi:hypothetical protein